MRSGHGVGVPFKAKSTAWDASMGSPSPSTSGGVEGHGHPEASNSMPQWYHRQRQPRPQQPEQHHNHRHQHQHQHLVGDVHQHQHHQQQQQQHHQQHRHEQFRVQSRNRNRFNSSADIHTNNTDTNSIITTTNTTLTASDLSAAETIHDSLDSNDDDNNNNTQDHRHHLFDSADDTGNVQRQLRAPPRRKRRVQQRPQPQLHRSHTDLASAGSSLGTRTPQEQHRAFGSSSLSSGRARSTEPTRVFVSGSSPAGASDSGIGRQGVGQPQTVAAKLFRHAAKSFNKQVSPSGQAIAPAGSQLLSPTTTTSIPTIYSPTSDVGDYRSLYTNIASPPSPDSLAGSNATGSRNANNDAHVDTTTNNKLKLNPNDININKQSKAKSKSKSLDHLYQTIIQDHWKYEKYKNSLYGNTTNRTSLSPSPQSYGKLFRFRSKFNLFSYQNLSLSHNSIFAYYTQKYAQDKFALALRLFKSWYHEKLTYHHLSSRMEFNELEFYEWFHNLGEPLGVRALDKFDQIVIWIAHERDAIQTKTFKNWINKYLSRRGQQIQDLFVDLRDGQNLITLLEMLSGQSLPRERGLMRVHKLQNIQIALNYIKLRKVKLVNMRPDEIVDGNQKLTLGLIWTIILHFQLEDNSNFREILLRWAQRTTDGYPGCKVVDLTKSWRDGLAYNAILHRNRPDLLNYRECSKKTSRDNIDQAFTIGEHKLGVTRLLEPEDVMVPDPDEKSMITYLAQLYELFPDPPERNPLLDEEMYRRIDEYRQLARNLLQWIKDSTSKLNDRKFPASIPELRRLISELDSFRNNEVPPKAQDKQRLASVANEICRMANELGVRLEPEILMDNIDMHWDKMMAAIKSRAQALDDEIARAERLKALLEKLLRDIADTDSKLDGIERDMNNQDAKISALKSLREAEAFPASNLQQIAERLADCGIRIDSIKRLADDFIREAGRQHPDSIMVREKVAELDAKYRRLMAKLAGLHDHYERTIKRLRELDEAKRREDARREAEAKLRLKLDAMKRELDELERRIDSMEPVSKDIATLERQLAELQQFDKDLDRARGHLNDLIGLAESMIRDDLIANPEGLRIELQMLKDQLARIEDKAARRLKLFEDALKRAEAQKRAMEQMMMRLDDIKRKLEDLERRIDSMAPVASDLPTLERQLAELMQFDSDLGQVKAELNQVALMGDDLIREGLIADPAALRNQIKGLRDHVARIEDKSAKRMRAIQDALKRREAQKAAEAKYRLRLDDIRRELEQMDRQLDAMAPVSANQGELAKQLKEIQDFLARLQGPVKQKLADVLKMGEELIRDDMIAEPAKLRADMKSLNELYDSIDSKANKRLRAIQDAMGRVAASDAIQQVADWLAKAKRVLVNEEHVHGDLDTVTALIEQHKAFERELEAQQPAIIEVRRMEKELSRSSPESGAQVRSELASLSDQWREMEQLTRQKAARLDDALRVAQQLNQSVHMLLEWLADAELKLRFGGSLPDDETLLRQEVEEHERLTRKLATNQAQNKDATLKLAREILSKCHPDAEPVVKHWINIVESRWDEIESWAKQRGQRLADHLNSLREVLEAAESLIAWLTKHELRLLEEEASASQQAQQAQEQSSVDKEIDGHSRFMDELRSHESQVERVVRAFASKAPAATCKTVLTCSTMKPRDSKSPGSSRGGALASPAAGSSSSRPSSRTSYATYRDEYPDIKHVRGRQMLDKWRSVWQLALDKLQRLKERAEQLRELERLEHFDFDAWRRRYVAWINSNRSRVMDFFRSLDDDNDGKIPLDAFVSGILRARFESSRLEMERVAEIMDKNRDGHIDNKEYLDALRPDKPISDEELIQDEVQRQVARCTCAQRFRVYHVGDGRYRFGESQKLRLVRILRSTVMVRVGGGWEPLTSFLQKNDPCRAKGRTNIELREQFILPEGASQAMAAFRTKLTKDPSSLPALGPITKIREKTDRSVPSSTTTPTSTRTRQQQHHQQHE